MEEHELPKSTKKALRSLRDLAHEAALRRALESLSQDFDRWKKREIDSFELANRIHAFHNGPSREIYNRYTSRLDLTFLVGYAVQEGLIAKESIPEEVLPYLGKVFSLFRKLSPADAGSPRPAGKERD